MKLFIPTLGTKLILSKPFTFTLHDDRRNESFWIATHGKPVRQEYFYGYPPGKGKVTSPVKTKDCDCRAEHPAPPVKTTLSKGTTIVLDKISIRKGLRGDDHLIFRIPSNRTSPVPSGKFWASLEEVNGALDASVEVTNKYLNGKFVIQIIEGQEWSNNSSSNRPFFKRERLIWLSDPESARHGGRKAFAEHYTNTAGRDDVSSESNRYYSPSEGYSKSFATIEELLSWAEKKNFIKAHVDAFIVKYEEKKSQWEDDKKGIIAI